MHILQVINSLDPQGGGPAEQAKRIAFSFNQLGNTAEIVTLDPPDAPWLKDVKVNVHALGPYITKAYCFSPKLIPWLKQHTPEFDVVIVHGIWRYCSFAVWLVLRRTGKPYFVFTHGMLDPWFKKAYPLKHLKKWLYWPWAEYKVLRDARAVFFTSPQERLLSRQSFWLYKCKEEIVSYGVSVVTREDKDCSLVFLEKFPELRDKRIILFLSRIHPKKGCDLLIRAFSRVAQLDETLRLVIAGPGDKKSLRNLRKLSERLRIGDKISWAPMLLNDSKWGAFQAAEIFILPSHQENFGVAVAESLGCGVPVLITNKVNIWDIVAQYNAGIVSDDNIEGVVKLLEGWLRLSPEEKSAMKIRARACFLENFDVKNVAKKLIATMRENGVMEEGK
ncbi:MAG: glycosyltransferase [Candidatus Omnitrophota bacterium]